MADIDLGSLLKVVLAAQDHHDDESKPEVVHDLPALANQGESHGLGKLALQLLSDPTIVSLLVGLIGGLLKRQQDAHAERVTPKPTEIKTPPVFAEPVDPSAPGPEGLTIGSLEAWAEDAWHDWKKGEGNDDGQFDPNADVAAGMALPPAPVIWFLAGVQPGKEGHARIPQNEPETAFPVATHHFQWDDEEVHSFTSADDPGLKQPIPEIGHIQGGDKWGKSNGWGFILRVAGHHAEGPKTLNYWFEAAGKTSNVVAIPISHSKNN